MINLKDMKSVLNQRIPQPGPEGTHICITEYWVKKGSIEPNVSEKVSLNFLSAFVFLLSLLGPGCASIVFVKKTQIYIYHRHI